jgi:hypothetical protein
MHLDACIVDASLLHCALLRHQRACCKKTLGTKPYQYSHFWCLSAVPIFLKRSKYETNQQETRIYSGVGGGPQDDLGMLHTRGGRPYWHTPVPQKG